MWLSRMSEVEWLLLKFHSPSRTALPRSHVSPKTARFWDSFAHQGNSIRKTQSDVVFLYMAEPTIRRVKRFTIVTGRVVLNSSRREVVGNEF